MKKIICPLCGELIGYNKTGKLAGQEAMFCKNRPHKKYYKNRKFIKEELGEKK